MFTKKIEREKRYLLDTDRKLDLWDCTLYVG